MGDRATLRSHSERGKYDRDTLHDILDESLICHVALVQDGQVFNIPMLFARDGVDILLHASVKSRIYETLSNGSDVCLTATLLDGIVVAKSAFHSSMNYRSAMVFGNAVPVTGHDDKMSAARIITEKMIKGRWEDCRWPKGNELKSTGFLRLKIQDFSCKIREGDPIEDPEDLMLPHWSGVIPIAMKADHPQVSEADKGKIELPMYIRDWKKNQ